jgi:hypothetical protein
MEDDLLWLHFKPLWQSLKAQANENMLVAGGYALFLKHQWLLEHGGDEPFVIPFERWQDSTPRVTKDMDLVIGLDLISNQERHEPILQAIEENGFKVSEKPSGRDANSSKKLRRTRTYYSNFTRQCQKKARRT